MTDHDDQTPTRATSAAQPRSTCTAATTTTPASTPSWPTPTTANAAPP